MSGSPYPAETSPHILYTDAFEFRATFQEATEMNDAMHPWLESRSKAHAFLNRWLSIYSHDHSVTISPTDEQILNDRELAKLPVEHRAGTIKGLFNGYCALPFEFSAGRGTGLVLATRALAMVEAPGSSEKQPALVRTPIPGADIDLLEVAQ